MREEKLFKGVFVNSTKTVSVSTTEYEFEHGKTPRGFGTWAFLMGGNKQDIRFFTGKYSDCLRQAKTLAKEIGCCSVSVGA